MRRVIRLPGSADVGQMVEVGDMLFSSTITGADPATGNLGPEAARQTHLAFSNLRLLLDAAGVSTDAVGLVRVSVPSAGVLDDLDGPWQATFPGPSGPARRADVYPLPEGQLVQLQLVGARSQHRLPLPSLARQGGRGPGVRLGNLVFSSAISGVDPDTGLLVADRRDQVRQAFQNMEAMVRQAGGSMDDVAHVFIYVRDRADNDDVLAAFLEAFPGQGNRAARKNVFDDQLMGTATVAQLQMIAVLGQGRRDNYEVEGAAKRHPNPLGTRIGSLLFSAGIGGHDPAGREVERQAARALSNVKQLVEHAGGSLGDVAHVTFTVDDYAHTPIIHQAWRKLFPDPSDEPAQHVMAFGGRDGNYQIQVHVVAVLQAAAA